MNKILIVIFLFVCVSKATPDAEFTWGKEGKSFLIFEKIKIKESYRCVLSRKEENKSLELKVVPEEYYSKKLGELKIIIDDLYKRTGIHIPLCAEKFQISLENNLHTFCFNLIEKDKQKKIMQWYDVTFRGY